MKTKIIPSPPPAPCSSPVAARTPITSRPADAKVSSPGRQINDQDFIIAANAATQELLASGVLDKVKSPPAVLGMSRIVNSTGQQIDIDLLTKKIRVSGKAARPSRPRPSASAARRKTRWPGCIQQQQEFMNDQNTRLPDFTLSGKIIQNTAKAGNVEQSTYSFQLSLTDQQGLAVWEGENRSPSRANRTRSASDARRNFATPVGNFHRRFFYFAGLLHTPDL